MKALRLALVVVITVLWVAALVAMEATPDGFKLSPSELARCQLGGGCVVIPNDEFQAELAKWLKKAHDQGKAEGCRGT